jgi:hypothetical protein
MPLFPAGLEAAGFLVSNRLVGGQHPDGHAVVAEK